MPSGTRVMLVRDPTPRNRAEAGSVSGPSSSVSGCMWTYQRGMVKCRTNVAVQGMNQQDLSWVKIKMDNWNPPDGSLPLPEPQLYDVCSPIPSDLQMELQSGGQSPAQLARPSEKKQEIFGPHTVVWGECFRAPPPPPTAETEVPVKVQD